MSWKDNLDIEFIVTCGNKKSRRQYIANWMKPSQHIDYKIAEFDFKDLPGTLVKRGTPRGTMYDLTLFFQGADHLETFKKFKKDAADPMYWEVEHPYYGNIIVQPVYMTFDHEQYNVTKINATVIETLQDSGAVFITADLPTVAANQVQKINQQYPVQMQASVPMMDANALTKLSNNIKSIYTTVKAKLSSYQADINNYLKAYNQANSVLNTALYDTQSIISQAQALLLTPATFADTVNRRLNMLTLQMAILAEDVPALIGVFSKTANAVKKLYENQAGVTIAAICLTSVTNITNDYDYRPDVLDTISLIISQYNGYLTNLYSMQSLNGGMEDNYMPDANGIDMLAQLINNTVSALFQISSGAKQQRTMTVEKDTNIVILARELYGLLPDDSTITQLKKENNIGLNELFVIKKGRTITYYV